MSAWQAELPEPAREHLAQLLEIPDFVPASARPMVVTAGPPAPKPPSSAAVIAEAVAGRVGLAQVSVAERRHPLWLRAGTDDAAAAVKSLGTNGLRLPHAPRRILEIGAGAGYRTVALAQAWPEAEIISTEPDMGLQRVALLNTLPYRNISAAFLALSTDNAKHGFTGRKGEVGRPALARDEAGPIAAVQLKNFLYSRGWNALDTVVITPDAASDHLLRAPWPASVRLIAVETGGAKLHEATAGRFPDEKFLTEISGDYVLLHRREVDAPVPEPVAVPVFNPDGEMRFVRFERVSINPPAFFAIGAHGFRLHPNASDSPPARMVLGQVCRNYGDLHLTLRVALPVSAPVRFTVEVMAEGEILARAMEVLKGGERRSVAVKLAPYEGECEVVFTTEMAEFGGSNAGAWAEVLVAAFV
jgi:hypothetical protein